ncbi:hypothetical protein LTR37_009907 [Vermiconidia calcicola]|uniref:Uncharacterized protein n=1 Tax=Vermiconidia calcicola TaxID=1690605 RepID=A0ACC3N760_9PEZI|nr:hypothetical protein LTR37_009907 [Vermiconidia calcicola]
MRGVSSTNSQLDEGYSEETRSQSDSDMMYTAVEDSSPDARVKEVTGLLSALSPEERKQVMMNCIKALDNSDKEEIKKYIEQLTHFDPATYLPAELFLQVFAYFSPKDLLNASTISRDWRHRSFDERLWKSCFAREGWVLDKDATSAFEKMAERKGRKIAEGILRTGTSSFVASAVPALERGESRKRSRGEAFNEGQGSRAAGGLELDGAAEADDERGSSAESQDIEIENMEGVETAPAPETGRTARPASSEASSSATDNHNHEDVLHASFDSSTQADALFSPTSLTDFKLRPTVEQVSSNHSTPKLSWPYMYKQRRRLETNWEKGQYKMFQLPHPEHPEEGHAECVYTIQHTARHLVSGSRDRTIRIWDLQTYRLKGQPLRGHAASVLCLQFDERPEQDIIVSGGSDSSVIVWKFSTGAIVKKLVNAHGESVLNLRFDDRYIVTCSKDKTIKIWSRHALARDSELIPHKVIADFADPITAPRGGLGREIEAFTHLSTIGGHGGHHAAVNAVMIHDNTIVSASGDRTVKAWDLITGELKRSYVGHTKGIACVQFDGRRVVSGSSDNTVRIFDAFEQAEVACLTGHSNLVRTVQARFGDLGTTTNEELHAEARDVSRNFHRAISEGMTLAPASRRGLRNAGSARPDKQTSVNTRVPPGGGGTRWAKIVSGSYDETVIVWKRDAGGDWTPKLHLHQDMLLRTLRRRHLPATALPQPPNAGNINAQGGGAGAQQNLQVAQNALVTAQHHLTQVTSLLQPLAQPGGGGGQQLQNAVNAQGQLAQIHAVLQQQPGQNANATNTNTNTDTTTTTNHHVNANAAAQQAIQHAQQAQAAAAGGGGGGHRDSYRIFKLQFDARRIVCCSQNKAIVGWDFANGDTELERIGDWSLETA